MGEESQGKDLIELHPRLEICGDKLGWDGRVT